MARVSVIIPTYNRSDLLKQAIDSVLAQTFSDYEVIVVDDGSTDDTGLMMKDYSALVRYVKIAHTGLPAVARNVGLHMAQGDYISFLDSDDLWVPKKLEKQLTIMETHSSVGLVCSNGFLLRDNVTNTTLYFENFPERNDRLLNDLLLDGNFVITSTVMIRRSLLKRTGFFSENSLLRAIEDYDLWMRLAAISNIYCISEPLGIYRDINAGLHNERADHVNQPRMIFILMRLRQFLKSIGYRNLLTISQINRMIYAFKYNICIEQHNYFEAIFYICLWLPNRAIMLLCKTLSWR